MLWNTEMDTPNCLGFSGKASQGWQNFVWLLDDGENLIRKGTSRGMGQRGVLYVVPLQTPANIVGLNVFFPHLSSPLFSFPLLSPCWRFLAPAVCVVCILQVFPCTHWSWGGLLFNNGDTFISMHSTPWLSGWQFFHHKNVGESEYIQAASEIPLSGLGHVTLAWQNAVFIEALGNRWFCFGLTYVKSRSQTWLFCAAAMVLATDWRGDFSDMWTHGR